MILAQKITNPPAGVGRYSFNLFKKKQKKKKTHAVVLESGGWGKLIGGGVLWDVQHCWQVKTQAHVIRLLKGRVTAQGRRKGPAGAGNL